MSIQKAVKVVFMKKRNLIAVLAALGIVCGIFFFARTRSDDSRGTLTIWYVESAVGADRLSKLAEGYNKSTSRAELPVKLKGFADEEALAAAFDSGAPDLVFTSHYRAFDMAARGKLADMSDYIKPSSLAYPKELSSRNECIGKSFFPVGYDVPILLRNTALCQGADLSTLPALTHSAQSYYEKTGTPFYAVDSYSALFFTAFLREGEEFTAELTSKPSEAYALLYNSLAENAYTGAAALYADSAAQRVFSGELACAVTSVSALSLTLESPFAISAVPPLTTESGQGALGEAWGFAVAALGSRSMNDISAFLSYVFSDNRDARLALQSRLVPAQEATLITRDGLYTALLTLDPGGITALPAADSAFCTRRDTFERDFRARMAFLGA